MKWVRPVAYTLFIILILLSIAYCRYGHWYHVAGIIATLLATVVVGDLLDDN